MRFVGLDVSYRNVGVVVLDHAGTCVHAEHMKCTADRYPEGFSWHREEASRMFHAGDVVSIEGLSFGSIGKTHLLQGAHAFWVERAVAVADTVFVPVPMRVKLWALGSAKATKAEMKGWARDELSVNKISEHEADALSLAQIARAGGALMAPTLTGASVEHGLTAQRMKIFHNDKNTGLLQATDLAYFRGRNGEG